MNHCKTFAEMKTTILAVCAALLFVSQASACVWLMGESPGSSKPAAPGTHWNYGFRGDDWEGVDGSNNPWSCMTGMSQSPVNLQVDMLNTAIPGIQGQREYKTRWWYTDLPSNGSNIKVYNNGHTIQVEWPVEELTSTVLIQTAGNHVLDVLTMEAGNASAKKVSATPIQFHFHTDSEHAVNGMYYPMELHIVHVIPQSELPGCPASGCLTVTGIMFALSDDGVDNPILEDIWAVMPEKEGRYAYMEAGKALSLSSLFPGSKLYAQYSGSLTTPPCSEGLLWHVLTRPQRISLNQLRRYQRAVGLKECELMDHSPPSSRKLLGAASVATETAAPFVRGSYSGFVLDSKVEAVSTGRQLKEGTEEGHSYMDYNCTIVSYGFTNRNPQPFHDRISRFYT